MIPVVQVEGLSKSYLIRHRGVRPRYHTLREAIVEGSGRLARRLWRSGATADGPSDELYWALKDMSFYVRAGERLAIMGGNGAGKSTLLKILSRVTEPTEGKALLYGRVASLLEVGTGFHPELTGRENVFLSGAILGMKQSELRRRFDEIVEFADVERFLDTPVKRYSSGMYMRLAFSVAAHLEPDILIVDEVLAVGDMKFQEKCTRKMREAGAEGRTVLFVSHNIVAQRALCTHGLVLRDGRTSYHGDIEDALAHYADLRSSHDQTDLRDRHDREGSGVLRFTRAYVATDPGVGPVHHVVSGHDAYLVADFECSAASLPKDLSVSFALKDELGIQIADLVSSVVLGLWPAVPRRGRIVCKLASLPLNAGRYSFNVFARADQHVADWVEDAAEFLVQPGDFFGTGRHPDPEQGRLLLRQEWNLLSTPDTHARLEPQR
jgi:lipopolysaccharide transport system ATP-binding protein